MKAFLHRLQDDDKQTLGRFFLFDGLDELFSCCMLEPPDRDNEIGLSRICSGQYKVVPRWSEEHGHHFHILDVEGRTFILIHAGNYYTNTEGCLLPGFNFIDVNGDGYKDVTHSRSTLEQMLSLAPNGFELIIDEWLT